MSDYTLYSLAHNQFLTLLFSQSPPYSRSGRRRQRKCASARLHSGVCWNLDRPHACYCIPADKRVAHGVDLGDGRSDVQHISAKAGRICAHFSHPGSKGSASSLSWSPQGETEACIVQAQADGVFSDEILPIELRGAVVSVDDTVRPNVNAEGLAALKPSFPEWGDASTTAGNASGVGDGAALCIVTTRARAKAKGLNVLAKFVGTAIVGVEPRHMGIAPIYAIPKVLTQIGLNYQDIDVYEVSAFFVSLSHRLHESWDYEPDQRSICVAVRILR